MSASITMLAIANIKKGAGLITIQTFQVQGLVAEVYRLASNISKSPPQKAEASASQFSVTSPN